MKRNDKVWLKVDLRTGAATSGVNHKAGDQYKVLGFQGTLVRLSRVGDYVKLTTLIDNVATEAPATKAPEPPPAPVAPPPAPPSAPKAEAPRGIPAAADQPQRDAVRTALTDAHYKVHGSNDGGSGIHIFGFRDERVGGFYWSTVPGNQPLPMAKTPAKVVRLINEAWDRAKPAPVATPEPPPIGPAIGTPPGKDFDQLTPGTRVQYWNNSNSGFLDGTIIERHETPARPTDARQLPPKYDIRRSTGQVVYGVRATKIHKVLEPKVAKNAPAYAGEVIQGAMAAENAATLASTKKAPEAPKTDNYGKRPWLRLANERRALAAKGASK